MLDHLGKQGQLILVRVNQMHLLKMAEGLTMQVVKIEFSNSVIQNLSCTKPEAVGTLLKLGEVTALRTAVSVHTPNTNIPPIHLLTRFPDHRVTTLSTWLDPLQPIPKILQGEPKLPTCGLHKQDSMR